MAGKTTHVGLLRAPRPGLFRWQHRLSMYFGGWSLNMEHCVRLRLRGSGRFDATPFMAPLYRVVRFGDMLKRIRALDLTTGVIGIAGTICFIVGSVTLRFEPTLAGIVLMAMFIGVLLLTGSKDVLEPTVAKETELIIREAQEAAEFIVSAPAGAERSLSLVAFNLLREEPERYGLDRKAFEGISGQPDAAA